MSPTVVAAFRATLEELQGSDVLVHVIDVTHSKAPEQAQVVDDTLNDLGLGGKPRILVMNKMDLVESNATDTQASFIPTSDKYPTVFVSARKKWNLDRLLDEIEGSLLELDEIIDDEQEVEQASD